MQDPKTQQLKLYQGATFYYVLRYVSKDTGEPIDLTGYTARMHVRVTVDAQDVLLDFTVANGRITITPAEGKIVLELPAVETEALVLGHSRQSWVYDLELMDSNGFVTRAMEGEFLALPEVTRQHL